MCIRDRFRSAGGDFGARGEPDVLPRPVAGPQQGRGPRGREGWHAWRAQHFVVSGTYGTNDSMRVATYNPMHAAYHDRIIDISTALKDWEVIILTGTSNRALEDQPAQQHHFGHHWGVQLGYKKGRLTSTACG
eukprot:4064307-Pyramimonas_sp.AAC.1